MQRVRDPLVGQRVDAERLRRARLDAGITQAAIAERAMISDNWYRQIEHGDVQPSRPVLVSIAAALGITTGSLCIPAPERAA